MKNVKRFWYIKEEFRKTVIKEVRRVLTKRKLVVDPANKISSVPM